MIRLVGVFAFLFTSMSALSQIKKADKFVGSWRYKYDIGVEHWRISSNELIGEAFRKTKFGDSTKVEEVHMRTTGKLLVHDWTTYNMIGDSLAINTSTFVSSSRKLKFHNVDGVTPYMISYSFGFLNRNKLKIKIQYGINEKETVFVLERIK